MVVLDRADWLSWFDLTRPEAALLRPLPPARWSSSGRQAAAALPSVIGGPWWAFMGMILLYPKPFSYGFCRASSGHNDPMNIRKLVCYDNWSGSWISKHTT
jgi:hypothetical protein